jgi:hypothetical protein
LYCNNSIKHDATAYTVLATITTELKDITMFTKYAKPCKGEMLIEKNIYGKFSPVGAKYLLAKFF